MESSIGIFYRLVVRDKKGELVSDTGPKRSRSFLIAFLQLLECHMYPSVNVNIQDKTDTTRSVLEHANSFAVEAAVGSAVGLLVGTGTTTPTNTDYVIETIINHGTGAGQLQHGATSKITTQEVGANVDFQIIRTFTNGSGGTINVTESAFLARAVTAFYLTILRDTFTAVPVLNTQTLTVTYTLRTTV